MPRFARGCGLVVGLARGGGGIGDDVGVLLRTCVIPGCVTRARSIMLSGNFDRVVHFGAINFSESVVSTLVGAVATRDRAWFRALKVERELRESLEKTLERVLTFPSFLMPSGGNVSKSLLGNIGC